MHNFKKIIKTIVVVAVCVTLLAGLDMALYPCTFMRNDIHAVVSNQYDDIILGTSHGMTDIDPAVMEEITGRSGTGSCTKSGRQCENHGNGNQALHGSGSRETGI